MDCPFCAEEIKEHALACGHCGRDISFLVFREMRRQLDEALARVDTLETTVRSLITHMESNPGAPEVRTHRDNLWVTAISSVAWLGLPIVLLVFVHWMTVSVFDLDTRILRVASLLIPLPFGLRRFQSIVSTLWAAIFISVVSVIGMLASTSVVDHVSVLPEGRFEWSETIQYTLGIGLAYLVGSLISWRWLSRKSSVKSTGEIATELAAVLVRNSPSPNENHSMTRHRIETVAGWINTVMIILTAIGAVVGALGKFWPTS